MLSQSLFKQYGSLTLSRISLSQLQQLCVGSQVVLRRCDKILPRYLKPRRKFISTSLSSSSSLTVRKATVKREITDPECGIKRGNRKNGKRRSGFEDRIGNNFKFKGKSSWSSASATKCQENRQRKQKQIQVTKAVPECKKPIKDKFRTDCIFCGEDFSTTKRLERHMRSHTMETSSDVDSSTSSRSTQISSPVPVSPPDGPDKHELTDDDDATDFKIEKNWKCELCGKEFHFQSNLEEHIRRHVGDKPFKCKTCKKSFASQRELREHQKIHGDYLPFKCKICSVSFRVKKYLKNHMSRHTNDKKFRCNICGKGFRLKSYLDDHCRRHTGETPFKCPSCKLRFNSYSARYYHLKTKGHFKK